MGQANEAGPDVGALRGKIFSSLETLRRLVVVLRQRDRTASQDVELDGLTKLAITNAFGATTTLVAAALGEEVGCEVRSDGARCRHRDLLVLYRGLLDESGARIAVADTAAVEHGISLVHESVDDFVELVEEAKQKEGKPEPVCNEYSDDSDYIDFVLHDVSPLALDLRADEFGWDICDAFAEICRGVSWWVAAGYLAPE